MITVRRLRTLVLAAALPALGACAADLPQPEPAAPPTSVTPAVTVPESPAPTTLRTAPEASEPAVPPPTIPEPPAPTAAEPEPVPGPVVPSNKSWVVDPLEGPRGRP